MKRRFLKPVGLMMLAVTALTAVLSGCKEKEPEYPTQAKLEIIGEDGKKVDNGHQFTINKAGGEANALSIAISGTRDWTLTQQDGTDWLTVTPKNGEKGKNTTLTLSATANTETQRESKITVKANDGSATANFTVVQAGNDTPGADAIYYENVGTSVSKVDDRWPLVTAYTDWTRAGDVDQSSVTYTGDASVRNSGKNWDPVKGDQASSTAPYAYLSGANSQTFKIGEVNTGGKTNFTFLWVMQDTKSSASGSSGHEPVTQPITASTVKLEVGFNGTTYAEVPYTVGTVIGDNGWTNVSAEFAVPAATEKLYIKISGYANGEGLRLDNFSLKEGGSGSVIEPAEPPAGPGEIKIKQLITDYWVPKTTISANTIIVGTVVSNSEGQNFSSPESSLMLVDGTEANSGIFIYQMVDAEGKAVTNHSYTPGTNLKIDLAGATMEVFSGTLRQVKGVKVANIQTAPDGTTTYSDPVAIDATALANYQSMLVKVDCTPEPDAVGQKWNGTRGFTDSKGTAFDVYARSAATFAGETIPSKSGSITGIVGIYNSNPQLQPRLLADIVLNTDVELPELTVNPESLSFETAGGTKAITVTATVPQGYELKLDKGSDDWYTATFNQDKSEISVVAVENTGADLNGVLKVYIDGPNGEVASITKEIAITQSGTATYVTVLSEDFSSITAGSSTTTNGSSSAWEAANENFPLEGRSKNKDKLSVYQAGGAIRIGANDVAGYITSKELDLSAPFKVTIKVKGWSSIPAGAIFQITVGAETQDVTYTQKMTDPFGTYSVNFDAATATSTVKITATNRAFLDEVLIEKVSE